MKTEQTVVNDPMLAEIKLTYSSGAKNHDYPIIDNPADVYGYLCDIWEDGKLELQEEFIVIILNSALRALGWSKISTGGKTATIVDVAMVIQIALLANAHAVIIAHNHPSGTMRPSSADINLTNRINKSLKLMGITLHDHVIIARDQYYSFKEHRQL